MSEYDPRRKRKAEDYADRDRDDQSSDRDAYEPTYRDGSAKNECWRQDDV